MEALLKKLKRHAEQVEVAHIQNEATTVDFENNQLKSSKIEETSGMAVRVVRNGKLGFAASSNANAIDQFAANALESAAYGDPIALQFDVSRSGPQVATFDPQVAEAPVSALVDIGEEIIAAILDAAPDCMINVSIKRGVEQFTICDQSGGQAGFSRTPLTINYEIQRVEGDDVLILFDQYAALVWTGDYLAFTRNLADKIRQALTVTSIKGGKMPVIFSPTGSWVLGLPLIQGLNGKNVYTGISPLKGKVGEKLFDDKFSLIDDGTLNSRLGSAPFDLEGVPRQRNTLVENGVLNGFLFDKKTAFQAGVESTGNGARSLFQPPAPSPSNLVIQPGETPVDEMIASIDHGILINDVLGLGQGNVISGAFSNPLNIGLRIEKGEVVGRVKNTSIADNVYRLLKEVTAISREQSWAYGNLFMPYILLPEINVVAKG